MAMKDDQGAEQFFQQPVFEKFAQELARRYYLKGDFGRTLGLQLFKGLETEPLRQFLGVPSWEWETQKRVQIATFSAALSNSVLKWSVNDFITYLTKQPLVLKSEVEAQRQVNYSLFLTKINQIDAIFCEQLTEKQLKQWFHEEMDVVDAFEKVSKAWHQLPKTYTYLPFFAYQLTGDAHAFDESTFAGRLLLQLFAATTKEPIFDQQLARIEEKNALLNEFFLLKDDIHNFVAIRGLVAKKHGQVSTMWHQAWLEKTAWNAPLKEILQMDQIYSVSHQSVLIIENSAVYSVLLELLPDVAMICSSGQFTYAVWQLLRKLVASGTHLYYSGDLDPEGLLMAQKLIEMFPKQVSTIGMTLESYQVGKKIEPLLSTQLQQLKKIQIKELKEIAEEMAVTHKKAYQEGFIDLIVMEVEKKLK